MWSRPELKICFDDALNFIKGALQTKTSKASYLHGSFGSGKSHFMAVLHLILQGNIAARGIPELASVITKHNDWIAGKKFLLVPYHMIGSADMESGILGGYVEFIRRVHPDAPIPGVYLAEGLFRDAENLRKQMGDARFFGTLGEGSSADSEFGDVDRAWDAERFETAIVAPPGSEERSQLISTLIGKFFGSYDTQAGAHGEAFLSLDKGLSVLSKHAASSRLPRSHSVPRRAHPLACQPRDGTQVCAPRRARNSRSWLRPRHPTGQSRSSASWLDSGT